MENKEIKNKKQTKSLEYYAQKIEEVYDNYYIKNCGKKFSYDNKVHTTLIEKISSVIASMTDEAQKEQLLSICKMNLEERRFIDSTNWQIFALIGTIVAILATLCTVLFESSLLTYFFVIALILTLLVMIVTVAKNLFKPNRRIGFYTLVISVIENQLK